MRAILIAFLFWHCCSHRMVSCTQTENTTSTAGTTHSGVESTIAHVDRKDSAIVTDRNSVAKTIRSEIDVGQRPAVDTRLARSPKEPVPAKEAKTDVAGREYAESTAGTDLHIGGRNSESASLRSCIASRDCDQSLNERCVASDAGLICGCGQGYTRNEKAKICELADGSDPNAVEYEASKQRLTMLSDGAEERNDSGDHVDLWKLYGAVLRRDVENDASDLDSVRARKERLLAELRRIREETPQEVVSEKTAHAAEVLRSEDREPSQVSGKVLVEPEIPTPVSSTGKSTVAAPALDDQLIDPVPGKATALVVESPKSLISTDSMNPMVMCPVLLPLQKPKDPAVEPCGGSPSLDGLKAHSDDSVAATLSNDPPISTHECEAMNPVEPSAALGSSDRTDVAESQEYETSEENLQAVPIQELPIAPADVAPISISGAPAAIVDELPTNDSLGADIPEGATVSFSEALEALILEEPVGASVEAAVSEELAISTGESHQDSIPEELPISSNDFPEGIDLQVLTHAGDDTSENGVPEKLVTPTNVSSDVVIPELQMAKAEEALVEEEPAIPTEAYFGHFISRESALLADVTPKHQVAAEIAELEDDFPHAPLAVELVTPLEESSRAAIPEEQENQIDQAANNSKAAVLGTPRSLTPAKPMAPSEQPSGGEDSQKCTCFLDNAKTSHANSEAESESEQAAEMKTIGGNSSDNLETPAKTPLPTTGDSRRQEIAN